MQKVTVLLFRAVPHRGKECYPQRGLPRELRAIGPLQLVMPHWDKACPASDYVQKPVCRQPHNPTACSRDVLLACSVTGWFGSGWLRGLGMKILRSPFWLCTFLLFHPSDFFLEKNHNCSTAKSWKQRSKSAIAWRTNASVRAAPSWPVLHLQAYNRNQMTLLLLKLLFSLSLTWLNEKSLR